jgi:hypothetical protein
LPAPPKPLPDHDFLFHARSIADAEEATNPSTLALLQNLLPVAPALALGMLALEGQELAAHEPSVPALTVSGRRGPRVRRTTRVLVRQTERLGWSSRPRRRPAPLPRPRPQVLLLSLAAYAGSVVLQALLRAEATAEGWQLVTAAAWMVAILLDFFVSGAGRGRFWRWPAARARVHPALDITFQGADALPPQLP